MSLSKLTDMAAIVLVALVFVPWGSPAVSICRSMSLVEIPRATTTHRAGLIIKSTTNPSVSIRHTWAFRCSTAYCGLGSMKPS